MVKITKEKIVDLAWDTHNYLCNSNRRNAFENLLDTHKVRYIEYVDAINNNDFDLFVSKVIEDGLNNSNINNFEKTFINKVEVYLHGQKFIESLKNET